MEQASLDVLDNTDAKIMYSNYMAWVGVGVGLRLLLLSLALRLLIATVLNAASMTHALEILTSTVGAHDGCEDQRLKNGDKCCSFHIN